MPTDDRMTVVLVDDHELIRHGLSRAFERTEDFTVVGQAGTIAHGKQLLETHSPTVLVTDMRLPDGTGNELASWLRDRDPKAGIVVLTMYAGDEQMFAALDAGASAFVSKEAPAQDVVAAARHAAVSPRTFAAADLAQAMMRKMTDTSPRLSSRESEVLRLLSEGLGVAAIAKQLFISESTAKTHISKIYDKLGAANRAQAITLAMRAGLLAQPPSF